MKSEAIIHPLHEKLATNVCGTVKNMLDKGLARFLRSKTKTPGTLLWEGQPALPVQPSVFALKFLRSVIDAMRSPQRTWQIDQAHRCAEPRHPRTLRGSRKARIGPRSRAVNYVDTSACWRPRRTARQPGRTNDEERSRPCCHCSAPDHNPEISLPRYQTPLDAPLRDPRSSRICFASWPSAASSLSLATCRADAGAVPCPRERSPGSCESTSTLAGAVRRMRTRLSLGRSAGRWAAGSSPGCRS